MKIVEKWWKRTVAEARLGAMVRPLEPYRASISIHVTSTYLKR